MVKYEMVSEKKYVCLILVLAFFFGCKKRPSETIKQPAEALETIKQPAEVFVPKTAEVKEGEVSEKLFRWEFREEPSEESPEEPSEESLEELPEKLPTIYEFVKAVFDGKVYYLDVYNFPLRVRRGILMTPEGMLIGKMRLDLDDKGNIKGVTRIFDALFFKYPTKEGEKYNMAEYIRKYGYTSRYLPTNIPVEISKGEVETPLGVTEAWVYSINVGKINPKFDFIAKFYLVEKMGLVRTENWDHEGEIIKMTVCSEVESRRER